MAHLLTSSSRAGFFPGAILLVSKWYLPDETQTRIALLYTSAASGGAFSSLLAFGLAKMDGVGGYEGWRWVSTTLAGKFILLTRETDLHH